MDFPNDLPVWFGIHARPEDILSKRRGLQSLHSLPLSYDRSQNVILRFIPQRTITIETPSLKRPNGRGSKLER